MSLEDYLCGKLNVPSSEGAPLDITNSECAAKCESIYPNLYATIKRKLDIIKAYAGSKGVNLEPATVENFSISPMPREKSPRSDEIVKLVREYYESRGMIYDEKASAPSIDNPDPSIWFSTPEGRRFYVTHTPILLNKDTMKWLISASFCQF